MPYGAFSGATHFARVDMILCRKRNRKITIDGWCTILMQSLFNFINIPLGYIIKFIANLFGGNFAVAVFVFTLLINLALIPLSIKSQKTTVQQTRIKPKLDELKKRYGDDKQKYSMAMQELYQQEGVSMSGGCLPMILRLVLMMSIYWLILSPLTYMAGAQKASVENISAAVSSGMTELKKTDESRYNEISKEFSVTTAKASNELGIVRIIRDDTGVIHEILPGDKFKAIEKDYNTVKQKDAEADIDFTLFGIDLTDTPKFGLNFAKYWKPIWLIPIFAFLAQIFTSILSMYAQKKNNPDAPTMAGMMLTMPLISLFIGFGLPGGVGFYWICSSLAGGLIQFALQLLYGPFRLLSAERAKELNERCDFEKKQLEKLSGSIVE